MKKQAQLIIRRINKLKTKSNSALSYLNKAKEDISDAIEEDEAYRRIYKKLKLIF